MDCPICRDLKRALEARLSGYVEARSSAMYRVSTKVAAFKYIELERAKSELEEHRIVCVSAIRVIAFLPEHEMSASLSQRAA